MEDNRHPYINIMEQGNVEMIEEMHLEINYEMNMEEASEDVPFPMTPPSSVSDEFEPNNLLEAIANDLYQHALNIAYSQKEQLIMIDDVRNNALHVAARNPNVSFVHFFVSLGFKLDAVNIFHQTPLHIAIRSENLLNSWYLLLKGAPVYARDQNLDTPLVYAMKNGFFHLAAHMLTFGVRAHSNKVLFANHMKELGFTDIILRTVFNSVTNNLWESCHHYIEMRYSVKRPRRNPPRPRRNSF